MGKRGKLREECDLMPYVFSILLQFHFQLNCTNLGFAFLINELL